jgi:hypothetical protein
MRKIRFDHEPALRELFAVFAANPERAGFCSSQRGARHKIKGVIAAQRRLVAAAEVKALQRRQGLGDGDAGCDLVLAQATFLAAPVLRRIGHDGTHRLFSCKDRAGTALATFWSAIPTGGPSWSDSQRPYRSLPLQP